MKNVSWSISRVLYGGLLFKILRGSHSSGTDVTTRLVQPTRMTGPEPAASNACVSLLFGLAPGGVYLATSITGCAVGSYSAFSPLPV